MSEDDHKNNINGYELGAHEEYFRYGVWRPTLEFSDGISLGFRSAGHYKLGPGDGAATEVLPCITLAWNISGIASLVHDEKHFKVHPGTMYIGLPGHLFRCTTIQNPCEILWCGIQGPGMQDVIKALNLNHGIFPYDSPPVHTIRLVMKELESFNASLERRHSALAHQLLDTVANETKDFPRDYVLQQVVACIHNNIDNSGFGVDDVADHMEIHRVTLNRQFKKNIGQSVKEYIQNTRISIACKALRSTSSTVAEIAQRCGFENPSNFTRAFKQLMGTTPMQHRAAQKEAASKTASKV